MKTAVRLGLIVLVAGTTGCASKPPAPTLDISQRNCTLRPELQRAFAMSFEKEDDHTVEIDDMAPCIVVSPGDARSTYSIFRLPPAPPTYVVGVTSTPIGQGLFSPHLLMLDDRGKVLRELPRDSFQFHGSSLYAGVRIRPLERYLIVASDPLSIGKQESQITGAIQSNYISTGIVGFIVVTGSETTNQLTYAHNGKVTVTLKKLVP